MPHTYVDDKPSTNIDRTPRDHPASRGEHPAAEQLEVSANLVAVLRELQRSNVHTHPPRLTILTQNHAVNSYKNSKGTRTQHQSRRRRRHITILHAVDGIGKCCGLTTHECICTNLSPTLNLSPRWSRGYPRILLALVLEVRNPPW